MSDMRTGNINETVVYSVDTVAGLMKERDDARAALEAQSAQIARLRDALENIASGSPPDDWQWCDTTDLEGYGKRGDADFVDEPDETNMGDVHDHGICVGLWDAAKRARAALADPTGADWLRERLDADREACAKVADEHRDRAKAMEREANAASVVAGTRLPKLYDEADRHRSAAAIAANIAAAIRQRGEQGET